MKLGGLAVAPKKISGAVASLAIRLIVCLCGPVLLPIGEETDAVAGGEDIDQAVLELVEGRGSGRRSE